MKFELTKAEAEERQKHISELEKLQSEIENEMRVAREKITAALAVVNARIADFNSAMEAARNFAEEFAARMREGFDERSEAWQAGDRGSEVEGFISGWEGVAFMSDLDDVAVEINDPEPDFSEFSDTDESAS